MGFAIRMKKPGISASPLGPPPGAAPADDESDEQGETCSATITPADLDELKAKGSVTLQSDDGDSVVLTLDESGGGEEGEGEQE